MRNHETPIWIYLTGGLLAVAALITAVILAVKLEKVQPGYVGVSVKQCSGGGVSKNPIPTGYYWRELFCEDVIKYPTSMQSLILDRKGKADESITITSSEGLNINLDVAVNFTLDPKEVPGIYEKWRSDVESISHKYIRQTVRESLQVTFAKYTAEQLYSDKKEAARADAEKLLNAHLRPLGFIISQFTINRIDPPAQVIEAINKKVSMVQEAQRSQQEVFKKQAEAAQAVATAEGEAKAAIARAEGRAKAITTEADAQAKANRALAESVTPQLIEYEKMRRWNGVLPQFQGAGTPLISVGGK